MQAARLVARPDEGHAASGKAPCRHPRVSERCSTPGTRLVWRLELTQHHWHWNAGRPHLRLLADLVPFLGASLQEDRLPTVHLPGAWSPTEIRAAVTSEVQPLAVVAPSLRIALGPLELLLRCDGADLAFDADWYYRPFVSPAVDGATRSPEAVDVRFEIVDRPRADGPLLFESSALWSVRGEGDRRALAFRFPADTEPVFVLHLDLGSRSVRGECSTRLVRSTDGGPVLDCSLLSYPLDQVLAMYLLGSDGFVLHAAGALVNGRGVVLSGVSRAGKTTFSRLALGRPGWEPLSDDRVILTTGTPLACGAPPGPVRERWRQTIQAP